MNERSSFHRIKKTKKQKKNRRREDGIFYNILPTREKCPVGYVKIRLYLEINQNRLFPSPGSASRYINISNEYERGGGGEEEEEEEKEKEKEGEERGGRKRRRTRNWMKGKKRDSNNK